MEMYSRLPRLPQQYAVNTEVQNVLDGLQLIGEECILLHMFQIGHEKPTQPRCPVCYDETYQQENTSQCTNCFGTTYKNGVKAMGRIWSVLSDTPSVDLWRPRGTFAPEEHQMSTEAWPEVRQHDYVIRVQQWTDDHKVVSFGQRYVVNQVRQNSLRTGAQYGQNSGVDRIGQTTLLTLLPGSHVIYKCTLGLEFPVQRLEDTWRMPYGYGGYGYGSYGGITQ